MCGVVSLKKPVETKPSATKIPETIRVILGPVFLQIKLPAKAPRQKKHMVRVKLNASAESAHPNTSLNGTFKIDQAYSTPENSIEITPTAK
jgi:hypothetical protein